jgi:hypothetical protein
MTPSSTRVCRRPSVGFFPLIWVSVQVSRGSEPAAKEEARLSSEFVYQIR